MHWKTRPILGHDWIGGIDNRRQITDSAHMDIYFRELRTDDGVQSDSNSVINECEGLLIFAHKSVFNISYKDKVPPDSGLRILNCGDSRNLMPEVSHRKESDRYW